MHIKKTLGIAAVTALLAVPALGVTNANASVNMNSHQGIVRNSNISGPATHQDYNYKGNQFSTDARGNVIALNGQNNPSDSQVNSALGINNNTENSESRANTRNNNNSQSTATKANNAKLVQTGESNTGAKAGIVGAIAAMVSVAFVGVEKFFKRA